jgi:hypothetical protein
MVAAFRHIPNEEVEFMIKKRKAVTKAKLSNRDLLKRSNVVVDKLVVAAPIIEDSPHTMHENNDSPACLRNVKRESALMKTLCVMKSDIIHGKKNAVIPKATPVRID